MQKNAVIRFAGQARGKRTDAIAALTFLLERGYRRQEMTTYYVPRDGRGEECTWRYVHPDGREASLRICYPHTEEN